MQPQSLDDQDRPVIDVRIIRDTGPWQQRSAVFADASALEALVWMVEAVGQALVGEAALTGVRGFAMSRQRDGKPAPRLVAHTVARRFIEETFGEVVQDLPFEEEVNDGSWVLHFESEPAGRRYVVKLKSRLRRTRVTGIKRTDGPDEGAASE